jgi:hypothetical protein
MGGKSVQPFVVVGTVTLKLVGAAPK